ncbi:MAG: Ca-activated chloride channel family protein [Oceanicoccus sp.]|jgi:Ca-activated chloride channel family protein
MKFNRVALIPIALVMIACADQLINDKSSDVKSQPEVKQASPLSTATAKSQFQREYDAQLPGGQPVRSVVTRQMKLESSFRQHYPMSQDREKYQYRGENTVKLANEEPVSTFSIDVDTAAYSNIRRMINREGRLPPRDAVKAEEMLNYFSYSYPLPEKGENPFSVATEIAPSPWNKDRYILQIGLQGYEIDRMNLPNANLVFLIDVSGSMQSADKLGLVKKSLRLLVKQMQEEDSIALVVYAGAAGIVLEPTSGKEKAKILNAIDNLEAGGSTNGSAGIQLAYNVAQQKFIEGGINRVIIASDGDMNVGIVDHESLKGLIEEKRKSGIALTTLGYGSGNYNDALMEQLADIGNGNAAYIDSLQEANKVLVKEMQSTLMTIAKDVKIQIEFNPENVAEYRLIGYQNRLLNREDFDNDKVDAGDIGAGHSVTALYEISLVGGKSTMIPDRRYQSNTNAVSRDSGEIAFVKLRYKRPQSERSLEFSKIIYVDDIKTHLDRAGKEFRFASAVAGFAQLLRGGTYVGDWGYTDLLELAKAAKGDDQHGYRGEFISLVELAQNLSDH